MRRKRIPDIKEFEKKAIAIEAVKLSDMAPEELDAFFDKSTGEQKIGLSHFFGEVDVPEGFKWPYLVNANDENDKYPL